MASRVSEADRRIRVPWLGAVGAIVVLLGLLLGYAKWTRAFPGLIILAGCVACVVFLMANELAATRASRKVRGTDSDPLVSGQDGSNEPGG